MYVPPEMQRPEFENVTMFDPCRRNRMQQGGRMDRENNLLGDTIRSLRKRAKMTQEELAEGICSPVSVSRIENGAQMPSGVVLESLLNKLGTSTYGLCGIYYKTDRQLAFEKEADHVAELLRAGQLEEARQLLGVLEPDAGDCQANLQYYLLLKATVRITEGAEPSGILATLKEALALTKPEFDMEDFRHTLLTVREANILSLYLVALYQSGEAVPAIRAGEELLASLRKHQSFLSGYRIIQINVAHNVAQLMETEHRFQEALAVCKEAEALSLNNPEQMLLPEIEFLKAQLCHRLGNDAESVRILKAVVPYMELIQKTEIAALARSYAKTELNQDI